MRDWGDDGIVSAINCTVIMYIVLFGYIQVRVENVGDPADHIPAVLERVRPEYLTKTYQVELHSTHSSHSSETLAT